MKLYTATLLICFGLLALSACSGDNAVAPQACDISQETNGLVVIEAEDTDLASTNWQFRSTDNPGNQDVVLTGYVGDGYIEYYGPDSFNDPADEPIRYTFAIDNPGTYIMVYRTYKNHTHDPEVDDSGLFAEDRNNDAFVKVEGDYAADTDYERGGYFGAPKNLLENYTKFIARGDGTQWNRTGRLEDSQSNFYEAAYEFQAGETYTLSIIGRSFQLAIDRIYFIRMYDDAGNADVEGAYQNERWGPAVVDGDYEASGCS